MNAGVDEFALDSLCWFSHLCCRSSQPTYILLLEQVIIEAKHKMLRSAMTRADLWSAFRGQQRILRLQRMLNVSIDGFRKEKTTRFDGVIIDDKGRAAWAPSVV